MTKQYLLFDLDGTLTDSMEGIANSVLYALEHFGIHEEDMQKVRSFIGPPLKDTFMNAYGFDEKKADEAVEKYREYFSAKGLLENAVYPGIPELLAELKAAGKTLLVATSKPTVYSRRILEHFDLMKYFSDVQGSNLDGSRAKKDEVIEYVLEENGISDRSAAVMIGDRKHDVLGGKKCGLDTVGVLYGFGSRQELEAAGAEEIAEDVVNLGRILLGTGAAYAD